MPTFSRTDVPFLLNGSAKIDVDVSLINPNKPFERDGPMLETSFAAAGQQTVSLGQASTVKIGVTSSATAGLAAYFPGTTGAALKTLKSRGLGDFFKGGARPNQVIVGLELGAAAGANVAGSFSYAPLTAAATVEAAVDGGYSYYRAFDASLPARTVLPAFFREMRLPEQLDRAPEPGESISLRYGGYLRLGAEASVGYKLAGTRSLSVGELELSERYGLSVLGRIGLNAGVAGRFAITVTADADRAGWARVQVRRHRSADARIAADVNVTFVNHLEGLPADADDFLGAVLGVNGRSFIHVLQRAHELSDFETLSAAIDGLARRYIAEFVGKGFDALRRQTEFTTFLGRVHAVVSSYETLEERAITLFDKHFDELVVLTEFLDRIAALDESQFRELRSRLTPRLWTMLSQLTDGDPLGFLLGRIVVNGAEIDSLAELQKRARAVLSLIRDDAHEEVREVIAIAKRSFRFDGLLREAAKIDTVDELEALANEKVGQFVSRLVGRTLDSATNLKAALAELKAVLDRMDAFTTRLYAAFKEATNSSYSMALHAEYSRATDMDVLVDISIDMSRPEGRSLMAQAARGEFEAALTNPDVDVVRLHEGVLTHRTKRESAFAVNIVGWHLGWKYEGFDRVITETEQRLVPSDRGVLILSTSTLEVERRRKRQDESMHARFLLQALGQSAGVIRADDDTRMYVIDSLASLTARYDLAFTDEDTSEVELRDYLAFARDVGLASQGASIDALLPLLPRAANGGFGRMDANYQVRFSRASIEALLKVKSLDAAAETRIRTAMRRMVLANYLKNDAQLDVAFAYATPAVHARFAELGPASFTNVSSRQFAVSPVLAVRAPARVDLGREELFVLSTLIGIEQSMVDAIRALVGVLASGKALEPADFEKKLGAFGEALVAFDRFDQTSNSRGVGTTTIFAMVDALARQASASTPVHDAVLQLRSEARGRVVEKIFLSEPSAPSDGQIVPTASTRRRPASRQRTTRSSKKTRGRAASR